MNPTHHVELTGWNARARLMTATVYANTERGGVCMAEWKYCRFYAAYKGHTYEWKVYVVTFQGNSRSLELHRSDLAGQDDIQELVEAKIKEEDVGEFEQSFDDDGNSTFTAVESSRTQTGGTTQ